MSERFWVITGHESTASAYQHRIPENSMTEAEVIALLQRLASRHLDIEEVISSSLRTDAPRYSKLLEPVVSRGGKYVIAIGNHFHYTAAIEDADTPASPMPA
jgi:hypothetical protein